MGLFSALADGIANGFSQNKAQSLIRRLCRELGWSIDEMEGDLIKLHFKDSEAVRGMRKICINTGDALLHIFGTSHAFMPKEHVPEDVIGYLLCRNHGRAIGNWSCTIMDDGTTGFILAYTAFGDALDPPAFQFICGELISELSDFDGKMRQAGLLH